MNLLEFERGQRSHGHVIFAIGRGRDRVHGCRMTQHLVLRHQRGSRDLRHHEPRLKTRLLCEKRWQPTRQTRVHQLLDSPLTDVGKLRHRHRGRVERERDRLAVKVTARDDLAAERVRFVHEDKRVVGARVGLSLDD